jgi:hypothetical protein
MALRSKTPTATNTIKLIAALIRKYLLKTDFAKSVAVSNISAADAVITPDRNFCTRILFLRLMKTNRISVIARNAGNTTPKAAINPPKTPERRKPVLNAALTDIAPGID